MATTPPMSNLEAEAWRNAALILDLAHREMFDDLAAMWMTLTDIEAITAATSLATMVAVLATKVGLDPTEIAAEFCRQAG